MPPSLSAIWCLRKCQPSLHHILGTQQTTLPAKVEMASLALQYVPLQKPREFRLISIRPGAAIDLLVLELSHSTLDEENPPDFEALSYAWGSLKNSVTAQVLVHPCYGSPTTLIASHHEVILGQNLGASLAHLRRPSTAKVIWAGAICINQEDLAERLQQVLLMGDIYRLAAGVVAFLGPEAEDSSGALELLEKVGSMVGVDFLSGDVRRSVIGRSRREGLEWADMQRPPTIQRRETKALIHLLGREWFERLWTRQEIGLAGTRGAIQCGHKTVAWPLFCQAVFVIHRKPMARGEVFKAACRSRTMWPCTPWEATGLSRSENRPGTPNARIPETGSMAFSASFRTATALGLCLTIPNQSRRSTRRQPVTRYAVAVAWISSHNASSSSEHRPGLPPFRAGSLTGLRPRTQQIYTMSHQSCTTSARLSPTSTTR